MSNGGQKRETPATEKRTLSEWWQAWSDANPGTAILIAVGLGLLFVPLAYALGLMGFILLGPNHTARGLFDALHSSPPWTLITGIIAAPALLLTWYWRTVHKKEDIQNARETLTLQKENLLPTRLAEAFRLLGDAGVAARLGGIYALERIAHDSVRDEWAVLDGLAAFVRMAEPTHHGADLIDSVRYANRMLTKEIDPAHPVAEVQPCTTADVQPPYPLSIDVQAAIAAMGRINPRTPRNEGVDLSGASVAGADLSRLPLAYANLRKTDLRSAVLFFAKLECADLRGAYLEGAFMRSARLMRARLQDADLSGADLSSAKLNHAMLNGAKLTGAHIFCADLVGAEGLNAHQVRETVDSEAALVSRELRMELDALVLRERTANGPPVDEAAPSARQDPAEALEVHAENDAPARSRRDTPQ